MAAQAGIGVTIYAQEALKSLAKLQRGFSLLDGLIVRSNASVALLQRSLGTVGASLGLAYAIRTLANFEQSMASVRAVTRATDTEFQTLERRAQKLGATTRYTASQVAEGMRLLAQAGLSTNDILSSIEDTLRLAQAGQISLASATDIAAKTFRSFNLAATDVGHVSDVLAKAANMSTTSIGELGYALKYVAPIASNLNVSVEDTVGALSALADSGINASMGGTSLRRMMSGLINPTAAAKKALAQFKLTEDDIDVRTRGLIPVLKTLEAAGFSASEAFTLFGQRGGPAFTTIIDNIDKLDRFSESLKDVDLYARETAQIMDNNLKGSFFNLLSAVEALIIQFSKTSGFTSALDSSIRSLADGIRFVADNSKMLLPILAGVAARFTLIAGVGLLNKLKDIGVQSVLLASQMRGVQITMDQATTRFAAMGAGAQAAAIGTGLLSKALAFLKTNWLVLAISGITAAYIALTERTKLSSEASSAFQIELEHIKSGASTAAKEIDTFAKTLMGLDKERRKLKFIEVQEQFQILTAEIEKVRLAGSDLNLSWQKSFEFGVVGSQVITQFNDRLHGLFQQVGDGTLSVDDFSKIMNDELVPTMRELGVKQLTPLIQKFMDYALKLSLAKQQSDLFSSASGDLNAKLTETGTAAQAAAKGIEALIAAEQLEEFNKLTSNTDALAIRLEAMQKEKGAYQNVYEYALKASDSVDRYLQVAGSGTKIHLELADSVKNLTEKQQADLKVKQQVANENIRLQTEIIKVTEATKKGTRDFKSHETAISRVDDALARLLMTSEEYQRFQATEEINKLAKALGDADPKIVQLRNQLEAAFKAGFNSIKELQSAVKDFEVGVQKAELGDFGYSKKQIDDAVNGMLEYYKTIGLTEKEYSERSVQLEKYRDNEINRLRKDARDKDLQTELSFWKEYSEISGNYSEQYLEAQRRAFEKEYEIYSTIIQDEVALNEWRQFKLSELSNNMFMGILKGFQKFKNEAQNRAKEIESIMGNLLSGIDSGFISMWENLLKGQKVTLDTFKDTFIKTLADIANMLITKPLVVSVVGNVVGNDLSKGVLSQEGSLISSVSGMFGKLGNTINDGMASLFPSFFSSTADQVAQNSAVINQALGELAIEAGQTSGQYAANAALNEGMGTLLKNGGTFLDTLKGAMPYAAISSLGYNLFGDKLGLPDNKYSGATSGVGGLIGGMGGSAFGPIGSAIGSAIGSTLGGALSGLFGSSNKTHPGTGMRVHDAPLLGDNVDYRELYVKEANYWRSSYEESIPYFDAIGEITNSFINTTRTISKLIPQNENILRAMQEQTWSAGRKVAGSTGTWDFQAHDEEQLQQVIADATDDIRRAIWGALVESLQKAEAQDFGLGDIVRDASYSLDSLLNFSQISIALQQQLSVFGDEANQYFFEAIKNINFEPLQGGIFGDIDFGSLDGLTKFTTQIQTLNQVVTEATGEQAEKMGDMEEAATESMAKLEGWKGALANTGIDVEKLMNLESSRDALYSRLQGVEREYQAAMAIGAANTQDLYNQMMGLQAELAVVSQQVEDYSSIINYQGYLQDNLRKSFEDLWTPMGDVEKQTRANIATINDYVAAGKKLGLSIEELNKMEGKREDLQKELYTQVRDLFGPQLSDIEKQTQNTVTVLHDYIEAVKALGATHAETGEIVFYLAKTQNDLVNAARGLVDEMGEFEKQAQENMQTLNDYRDAVRIIGEEDIASKKALQELEEVQIKLQEQFLDTINETLHPLSEMEALTRDITNETNDLIEAGKKLGLSLEQLAQIENERNTYLVEQQQALRQAFLDDLSIRELAVQGKDTSGLEWEISSRNELEEAIKKFGKDSAEYMQLQALLAAERQKALADEQAKANQAAIEQAKKEHEAFIKTLQQQYDSISREVDKLSSALANATREVEQAKDAWDRAKAAVEDARIALLQYYQDQVDATKKALDDAKDAAEVARQALVDSLVEAFIAARNDMKAALDAWVTEADRIFTEAQNAYIAALQQNAQNAASAFEQAQNAYKKALENQISEVEKTIEGYNSLASSLKELRKDLYLNENLNPGGTKNVLDISRGQVESLYMKSLSGDADAAEALKDLSTIFLESSYNTSSSFEEYIRDFYRLQNKLSDVEEINIEEANVAQKQLDTLREQLKAMEEPTKTLAELKEIMDTAYKTMVEQNAILNKAQEEAGIQQEKSTEELKAALEAARIQQQQAHEEQKRQYEKWGFEAVVPGIEGLKKAYDASLKKLDSTYQGLLSAIGKITTQEEVNSKLVQEGIKIVNGSIVKLDSSITPISVKILELKNALVTAQKAVIDADKKHTDAINAQLAAQAKYGVLEIKTQLQKLQDAIVNAQKAANDAAKNYYDALAREKDASAALKQAQAEKARAEAALAEAQKNQIQNTPPPSSGGSSSGGSSSGSSGSNWDWRNDIYFQNLWNYFNNWRDNHPNFDPNSYHLGYKLGGTYTIKALSTNMPMDPLSHYRQYGKSLGITGYTDGKLHARGGRTRTNELSIVGELGPELIKFGQNTKIFSTRESWALMQEAVQNSARQASKILNSITEDARLMQEAQKAVNSNLLSVSDQRINKASPTSQEEGKEEKELLRELIKKISDFHRDLSAKQDTLITSSQSVTDAVDLWIRDKFEEQAATKNQYPISITPQGKMKAFV